MDQLNESAAFPNLTVGRLPLSKNDVTVTMVLRVPSSMKVAVVRQAECEHVSMAAIVRRAIEHELHDEGVDLPVENAVLRGKLASLREVARLRCWWCRQLARLECATG